MADGLTGMSSAPLFTRCCTVEVYCKQSEEACAPVALDAAAQLQEKL